MNKRLAVLNQHFSNQVVVASRDLIKTTIYPESKVAMVEMTPPSKLIFLSRPLIQQVSDELTDLEKNPSVNVVILTGKVGTPSFATGANINELRDSTLQSQLFDDYFERDWFKVIPRFRKPLIAAINGYAFGGGLELAMMCDIIVASDKAKLG